MIQRVKTLILQTWRIHRATSLRMRRGAVPGAPLPLSERRGWPRRQANFRDEENEWVTTKLAMQQHIAAAGRNVHYCECSLANMFGMPSVEAFLRICLFERKVRDLNRQIEVPLPCPPTLPIPPPFPPLTLPNPPREQSAVGLIARGFGRRTART
jgi:hypothetical protein